MACGHDKLTISILSSSRRHPDLVSRSLTSNETAKGYFVWKREGYIDKPHVIVVRCDESIQIINQAEIEAIKAGQPAVVKRDVS